jgi:hypothetical protein
LVLYFIRFGSRVVDLFPQDVMAGTKKTAKKNRRSKTYTVKTDKPASKRSETVQSLRRELAEALEQQSATSDVLRIIAKAPGDLQSLLDAIAERAARLCDSIDAQILRLDDDGHVQIIVKSECMLKRRLTCLVQRPHITSLGGC